LTAEVKKQLGTSPADFDFTEAEQEFYKQLEEQKKEANSLCLSGSKLAEVLSLSVDEIKRLQAKVTELKHVVLPTIEDFTVYAETDAEIKKYNECINVIKAIKTVKDVLKKIKGDYYFNDLIVAYRPLLTWNLTTNHFEPNVQYIKASDV
jgi:ABC-type lipoprotein release transport system permease subunit